MSETNPAAEISPEVLDFLRGQTVMTLATSSRAGLPHAAILLYVNDGIALYFSTRPSTVTAQEIEQNPAVSFAIYHYDSDWSKMKGLTGDGECQDLLGPDDTNHVVSLFREKYSFMRDLTASNLTFFRVLPTSLQYINNERRDANKAGKTFGIDYQRNMVYNIFRELPRHQVDTVAAQLQGLTAHRGDVIVRQGAPADKFFIIADGEVEVVREDDGQERTVASLESGQFFGEMAILRDTPRTATVRATKETTLLSMDRDAFRSLIAQSLGTTADFDQVIRRRLEELSDLHPE